MTLILAGTEDEELGVVEFWKTGMRKRKRHEVNLQERPDRLLNTKADEKKSRKIRNRLSAGFTRWDFVSRLLLTLRRGLGGRKLAAPPLVQVEWILTVKAG
jgi:hypothetical protein